jgi:hypothetical protein
MRKMMEAPQRVSPALNAMAIFKSTKSPTATTVTPQPAISPVVVVAPAPVLTPDELAEQLAGVESENGKWFLVTQGLEPGIYASWSVFHLYSPCSLLLTGIS